MISEEEVALLRRTCAAEGQVGPLAGCKVAGEHRIQLALRNMAAVARETRAVRPRYRAHARQFVKRAHDLALRPANVAITLATRWLVRS